MDLHASAAVPQLFYELLFGNPAHFRAPYFDQPIYQLRLQDLQHAAGAPAPQQQEVLARINAVSPLDARLNYTLVSPETRSAFSVVPTTGTVLHEHLVMLASQIFPETREPRPGNRKMFTFLLVNAQKICKISKIYADDIKKDKIYN